MKDVTTTFRLSEDLFEKMRYQAYKNKVSVSEIIRRSCEAYITETELKVQETEYGPKSNAVCKE